MIKIVCLYLASVVLIVSCRVDPEIPYECGFTENSFTTYIYPDDKYNRSKPCSNPNDPGEFAYIKSGDSYEIRKYNLVTQLDEIIIEFPSWETPHWSIKNWIVFGNGGQIYKCKSDGDSLIQLTFDGENHSPSWSPDGTNIIFWRYVGLSHTYYYTMAEDGTDIAILDSTLFDASAASYSPDGLKLAFVHHDIQNNTVIAYIKLSDPQNIIEIESTKSGNTTLEGFLDWYPNSKEILYSDTQGAMYKTDIETGNYEVIKQNCPYYYYSPTLLGDGKTIISQRNNYLYYESKNTVYFTFNVVQINPEGTESIILF